MGKKDHEHISEDTPRKDYREKIIEIVVRVESQKVLESTYSFILGLLSVKKEQEAD